LSTIGKQENLNETSEIQILENEMKEDLNLEESFSHDFK